MSHDENEEEEIDPIKEAKIKKMRLKINDIMTDMADLVLDDEIREKIEEKLKSFFKDNGLTFTLREMNAFLSGMEFTIASYNKDERMTMMILITLRSLVEKRKVEIKKSMPSAL